MKSKLNGGGVVIAAAMGIFVTALFIIGITFAFVSSATSPSGPMDPLGTGPASNKMDPPSSYPLSVVPDPEDLVDKTTGDASGEDVTNGNADDGLENPEGLGGDATTGETASGPVDDGELHNGWNTSVAYTVREARYDVSDVKSSADYDMRVALDFAVDYPQIVGAGDNTEKINEALRDCAMDFVNDYWTSPTQDSIDLVKQVVEMSALGVPDDADALLSSHVTWAVTYNNDEFISVAFSDNFCIGSWAGEYLRLRCVNANLKTGETYQYDDVMTMTEAIANHFVDVLVANDNKDANGDGVATDDESFSVAIIGRDEWIRALMGEGDFAHRVVPTFFIDEDGQFNLGVSYWLGNDHGYVRGWWDAALTDEEIAEAKKDSPFWEVYEKLQANG